MLRRAASALMHSSTFSLFSTKRREIFLILGRPSTVGYTAPILYKLDLPQTDASLGSLADPNSEPKGPSEEFQISIFYGK